MATVKNNRVTEDIDEAFLLQSIKEQDDEPQGKMKPVPSQEVREKPEPIEPTEPLPEKPKEVKESPKRKPSAHTDYSSQFLQRNEFKGRQCVYVSQRIHETVLEIVKILSDKSVTVGGFIDTILTSHFEVHKDEITDLYNSELQKKRERNPLEI